MQEEIEHKTVNFAISTAKLSARTLLRGAQFFLRQYDKSASQGKQSMKRLIRQNRGVTNLEIEKTGIQADSLCKIVVQLIDGLGANPCCTCKFALCHPPFAEAGRQQNSNHSLLSPFTEILADMYPACLHFGRKLHISGVFSDFR